MLAKHLLKTGKGAPLVFLHGFLGSSADWAPVASLLPFRSIAVDLPGHGDSPFTADFCSALLETTKDLPPFHLIGYSMGGRLALQFGAKNPERILSLHIFSAHLGLKSEEEKAKRLANDKIVAREILELSMDEFLQKWYAQPLFKTLVAKMDIRSMRREQNPEGLSQAMEAFSLGRQDDYSLLPKSLYVGEFDEPYRAHYKERPHAVIEQAGHAVHLENPKGVARALCGL